ncbi:hypothetical protein [Cupriavidus metallidurans]|uniref:hypothetical protein n=1 Tax=Cupriavidus metallidurans TaxID=119219 RepID=UPI001644F713|nr:hypothetical protein [Cupriavidus metallidurans]
MTRGRPFPVKPYRENRQNGAGWFVTLGKQGVTSYLCAERRTGEHVGPVASWPLREPEDFAQALAGLREQVEGVEHVRVCIGMALPAAVVLMLCGALMRRAA